MRSWVFSLVGLSCLLGSLTAGATGQGVANPAQKPVVVADQKVGKEVKVKIEWITKTIGQNPTTESESVTVCAIEGQTTMTANPITSSNSYRRVTIRPDQQADGSYLMQVEVSEFAKDQDRDVPRISTMVKVKSSETKVIQERTSKGTGYEYNYIVAITPGVE